ncbi:MAG: AraC family transcriptional regulator [Cyclobacteriaceae bacterium]
MITSKTAHENSLLTATVYESQVEEDIILSDYNSRPCVSFPLRSGFAYRTTGFDGFVESNSFLVESQPNEFDIKKYKDLGFDLTVCFQFKESHHEFISRFNRNKCVESFRRTPELGFMIHAFMNNLDANKLFLDSAVDQILFEEVFKDTLELTEPGARKRWRLDQIDEAKAYMHANFSSSNLGIDRIASVSHLSRFHFGRTFKELTGYSPYEYLLKVRLHNARELLKKDRNITEVAFQSGFNSLENFSNAFKKEYNQSPLNFRNGTQKVY